MSCQGDGEEVGTFLERTSSLDEMLSSILTFYKAKHSLNDCQLQLSDETVQVPGFLLAQICPIFRACSPDPCHDPCLILPDVSKLEWDSFYTSLLKNPGKSKKGQWKGGKWIIMDKITSLLQCFQGQGGQTDSKYRSMKGKRKGQESMCDDEPCAKTKPVHLDRDASRYELLKVKKRPFDKVQENKNKVEETTEPEESEATRNAVEALDKFDTERLKMMDVKRNESGDLILSLGLTSDRLGTLVCIRNEDVDLSTSFKTLIIEKAKSRSLLKLTSQPAAKFTQPTSFYMCSVCEVKCDKLQELRIHAAQHHKRSYFFKIPPGHPHSSCLACQFMMDSYEKLTKEGKNITSLMFACPHCNWRFIGDLRVLFSHLKDDHVNDISLHDFEGAETLVCLVDSDPEGINVSCHGCQKGFATVFKFNEHLFSCPLFKDKLSGFQCRTCDNLFLTASKLKEHHMIGHDIRALNLSSGFSCPQCPVLSATQNALETHRLATHKAVGENCFVLHANCQKCSHFYMFYLDYKATNKLVGSLFQCPHCFILIKSHGTNFPLRNLHAHIQKFHHEGESIENYQPKMFMKNDPLVFTCEFCQQNFCFLNDFNNHLSVCDQYPNSSRPRCNLKSQVKDDKPWKCEQCSKVFISKTKLDKHRHSCFSRVRCTECDMMFKRSEDMHAHAVIHYGLVTCPIHNILFKQESEIFCHVNQASPNDKKPKLKCCMCGAIFQHMCIFMKHMRRHLDISAYKCDRCQKYFKTFASLKVHQQNVHILGNQISLFNCTLCNKSFNTKGHLKEHVLGIHERDAPGQGCPVCNKSFATFKRMKKHLYAIHKKEAELFRYRNRVEVFSGTL